MQTERIKMILQINYNTRCIEKIYNSITDIDKNNYDINKILQCCRGEISSYGGFYSDGCIWRFLSDLPYLKANFDFNDKDLLMLKMAIPGNVDYHVDNMIDYGNLISESIEFDKICGYKINSIIINKNNLLKHGIVQFINNRIFKVFPHISYIPSYIFDIDKIKPVLKGTTVFYAGFSWIKYDKVYNFLKDRCTFFI